MKKTILTIVMMLCAMTVAHAQQLAWFSSESETLSSWFYTGTESLTPSNVATGKINLLKTSGGSDYTLTSPLSNKGDVDTFYVYVKCRSKYYNTPYYILVKGSPTIELLDNSGNVIKSIFYEFDEKLLERQFMVEFDLDDVDVDKFKVRLACWNADSYCALTILEVNITAGGGGQSTTMNADVNGDGNVTAADVTALYDYLLNNVASGLVNGDVNGDGTITSADVTAVYDVILGS